MSVLLILVYTSLFTWLIFKAGFFNIQGISRLQLSGIFILKVLCGTGLLLIYKYYYETTKYADAIMYYKDGVKIYDVAFTNPLDYFRIITGIDINQPHIQDFLQNLKFWDRRIDYGLYNDNRSIIRFNGIVSLFSFKHIYVHTVFSAFVSFLGLTAILKSFNRLVKNKYLLLIAVYLVPSVLFWTSGILKDALLMLPLGFLVYFLHRMNENGRLHWKYLIGVVLSLLLVLICKVYVFFMLIPAVLSWLCLIVFRTRYRIIVFAAVHILCFAAVFNIHHVFENYNFSEIISGKLNDFNALLELRGNVGSAVEIPAIEPSFWGVLKNVPNALLISFFRPHVFEAYSLVVLMAALENLVIAILILLTGIFFRRKIHAQSVPYLLFSVSFILMLFTLTGLTTPVLGAVVRYKAPALPFLFLLFVMLINREKLFGRKWKFGSLRF